MRIAVIGGGSTYTPELIDGFISRAAKIGIKEIILEDSDEKRLNTVASFCKRMAKRAAAPFEIKTTLDLREAVDGASFILLQIRVGGQAARHQDTLLGMRHGLIGQETTGVGGFGKALRTIPVIKEIVKTAQEVAPDAWIINFTNPSGIITEAIQTLGVKRSVGLCNIPIGQKMEIAGAMGVNPDEVKMDYAGLNHLSFIRSVKIKGVEYIDQILQMIEDANISGTPANIEDMEYDRGFLKTLGGIPSPYLRYFFITKTMLDGMKSKPKTRAQEVMEIEERLLKMYADESLDVKPDELSLRGGAFYSHIALDILEDLTSDAEKEDVMITANNGAFPGLLPYQATEQTCRISKNGVFAVPLDKPMPLHMLAIVQTLKAYESLTVAAALENDYAKAHNALMIHPLCGPEKAKAVLEDIFRTFERYLLPYGWEGRLK